MKVDNNFYIFLRIMYNNKLANSFSSLAFKLDKNAIVIEIVNLEKHVRSLKKTIENEENLKFSNLNDLIKYLDTHNVSCKIFKKLKQKIWLNSIRNKK